MILVYNETGAGRGPHPRPRNVRELDPLCSGAVVVTEKSPDTLAPANGTADSLPGRTINQLILQPLVVPFAVVMRHELGKRPSKVMFTERDHAIEAFLLDRPY